MSDELSFSYDQKLSFESVSKSQVLSSIAKLYDPLGLLFPLYIKFKMFMQSLWQLKIQWTDPIPESSRIRWEDLNAEMDLVSGIWYPRRKLVQDADSIC